MIVSRTVIVSRSGGSAGIAGDGVASAAVIVVIDTICGGDAGGVVELGCSAEVDPASDDPSAGRPGEVDVGPSPVGS